MCQESAKFPSLFFSTRSPGRFLPPDDVALLILIGTKITSIFPFSTVFCTQYTARDEGGGDAPALALHRRRRVAAAFPSRTHHTQFRRIFGTDESCTYATYGLPVCISRLVTHSGKLFANAPRLSLVRSGPMR